MNVFRMSVYAAINEGYRYMLRFKMSFIYGSIYMPRTFGYKFTFFTENLFLLTMLTNNDRNSYCWARSSIDIRKVRYVSFQNI